MFCTKCGKEINENANFCVYCGAPVIIEDVKTESVEKQASISPTTDTIKSAIPSSTKDVVIKNKTSGIIKGIGVVIIILGLFASLILSIYLDDDFPIIFISGGVTSIVSGISFIGFSEIISLLQENINKQNKIIDVLEKKGIDETEK